MWCRIELYWASSNEFPVPSTKTVPVDYVDQVFRPEPRASTNKSMKPICKHSVSRDDRSRSPGRGRPKEKNLKTAKKHKGSSASRSDDGARRDKSHGHKHRS